MLNCGDVIGQGRDSGIAGCLVRLTSEPTHVMLVTAMHVLVGRETTAGGVVPAADGTSIGTLAYWSGLDGTTTVDAALVWVDPARVGAEFGSVGCLAGTGPLPAAGARLRLADGRSGAVLQPRADVDGMAQGPGGWTRWLTYKNQVLCEQFTQGGDSGAGVIDDENRLVGIVVAGGLANGTALTVITPIDAILSADTWGGNGLELVTSMPAEAVGPALPLARPAPVPAASGSMQTPAGQPETDRLHLHPSMRAALAAFEADLAANGVPMKLFEGFRRPARQAALYAKGRNAAGVIVDRSQVVSFQPPWQSYHQYGFAADMVIDKAGVGMWETGTPEAQAWWAAYKALAPRHGLETLAFEQVHVQVAGLDMRDLMSGRFPDGGDDTWSAAVNAAIDGWSGAPPRPSQASRPSLRDGARGLANLAWATLPRVADLPRHARSGKAWRVGAEGIYLDGADRPLRSSGALVTCPAIVALFGQQIFEACQSHGVPPELVIMVIATETGFLRNRDFSGTGSFRWEAKYSDYSAGPMQVLGTTGTTLNATFKMGYTTADYPVFSTEPNPYPATLPMYGAAMSIAHGTAMIRQGIGAANPTGTDPILAAARYNHGSLASLKTNPWGLLVYGDHLDRASAFYGDACETLRLLGR